MKTHSPRAAFTSLVFCGVVSLAGSAMGNAGTQMPLSQIHAGTEVTTGNVVQNPGFEQVTAGVPNDWLPDSLNMRVASPPLNPPPDNPSATGNNAAQALTNQLTSSDPENYHYSENGTTHTVLTFDPTKQYVLSGYLWNYGVADPDPNDFNPSDLALVELDDVTNPTGNNVNIATFRNGTNGDSANGIFDYISFAGSQFPNGATLDVRGDLGDNFNGTRPDVYAQFDNISITDAANFVPPTLAPEPASLALIGVSGLMMLRRRK